MTVREADAPWTLYDADRKRVSDMFKGRETALAHIRPMPGHEGARITLFASGAYFLPIVARTVEAFGGLVFAKQPTRTVPESLNTYLDDVTGSGQDVDRLAEQGFDGILLSGAIALLVDCPPSQPGVTRAQAEAAGIRPTLQLYTGTTILAARFATFGPVRKLAHVRLLERVQEPDPKDEFKLVEVEQVRVLDLDAAQQYRQRVFREPNNWAQYGETVEPTKGGQRLDHLPIHFANPRDGEPRPSRPVVADLAEISVAHLNNSAALEWALLWTANPTPVFIGLPKGTTDLKLGSSEGISLDLEGDAKFLEFTGQGLTSLETALETKRRDAAMMGARMLLESSKGVEAAETARINRAGEASVVGGIANSLSDCFTHALAELADWAGVSGEVTYKLATDFNPAGLSAQMITSLLAARVQGDLTEQELFALFQQNDLIDPAKTFDAHVEEQPEDDAEADLAAALGAVLPPGGAPPAKAPKAKAKQAPPPAV